MSNLSESMTRARIKDAASEILSCVGELRFYDCWNGHGDYYLAGLDRYAEARLIREFSDLADALGYKIERITPAVTDEPGFDGSGRMTADEPTGQVLR